ILNGYTTVISSVPASRFFFANVFRAERRKRLHLTPLEDSQDPNAKWGKSSRGCFKGFKAHLAVNQDGLVLKAKINTGNRYDSSFLPEMVKGFNPERVLADAGYDSEKNRKTCREIEAEAHIAKNPRNSGEEYELSEILKEKRSVVERFNSRLKELLKKSWQGSRGLTKTKTIIYTALIAMTTIAIQALFSEKSNMVRKINLYRNKPELITDGGPWYSWPAEHLDLNHHVVCSGNRNYVERWYQILKRRLQNFYTYFPTSSKRSIRNFMRVYSHWYNNSRYHTSLKQPPNQKTHGIKTWIKNLI
ncbi:hypothetical protein AKJ52_02720, partial [candidate division MSBL1 archaeon SCGC-AAA382C18]